jgi:hypothetical protein
LRQEVQFTTNIISNDRIRKKISIQKIWQNKKILIKKTRIKFDRKKNLKRMKLKKIKILSHIKQITIKSED